LVQTVTTAPAALALVSAGSQLLSQYRCEYLPTATSRGIKFVQPISEVLIEVQLTLSRSVGGFRRLDG
jgi:hypothetical protein